MYISIPKEMIFQKVTSEKNTRDCFVDPTKKRDPIELQSLLKEALRTNTGHHKIIKLKEFTIYLRTPPNKKEIFLEYSPCHNGKDPTSTDPKLISGHLAQKYDPSKHSRYGMFWYQQIELSSAKQEVITDKMLEQRENRRHSGNSPLAT